MQIEKLKRYWKSEEAIAHIQGWDFSHISGKYSVENDFPWNYKNVINSYLKDTDSLLDIDTGGGEFLLSLNHQNNKISATEAYPPNVILCNETLLPLGINFREANNYASLPFEDAEFDVVINRHGRYDIDELYRILKPGGLFITQQVGEDNERELVELLLPGTEKSFCGMNLKEQSAKFSEKGLRILKSDEAFRPILFWDIGALVWFAKIIEWEFPGFSVDTCFERLLLAQDILNVEGVIKGNVHRYFIVAQK